MGRRKLFLFPTPSFATGVGRLLDLTGAINLYNPARFDPQADVDAARADWAAVGQDMWEAIRRYATQPPDHLVTESADDQSRLRASANRGHAGPPRHVE